MLTTSRREHEENLSEMLKANCVETMREFGVTLEILGVSKIPLKESQGKLNKMMKNNRK